MKRRRKERKALYLSRLRSYTERAAERVRGLLEDAMGGLRTIDADDPTPSEMATLAQLRDRAGRSLARLASAEGQVENARYCYDVLCGCGWGKLALHWWVIPETCPLCGWNFWNMAGGPPDNPEDTIREAREQIAREALEARALEVIVRALLEAPRRRG